MASRLKQQPIPRVAFGASLLIAAAAVGSAFLFPERDIGLGVLIWITAVIPAFLLAYARGLGNAAIALAGGMAAIAAIQAFTAALESGDSGTTLPTANGGLFLGVAVGMLVLVEMLHRERTKASETALVDRLTGLPTRQYANMAVEQEFAAAERGRPLTIVMFNIDRLGSIKSRFGVPSGDAVVRAFATVLKANTRKENLSACFGDGQFISVLRESDEKAAMMFAQRVLDEMRDVPFPWGRQTVSAGIGAFEAGMGSYELLIGAADRALAAAKEGGRDSVAVAPDKNARAAIARRSAALAQLHSEGGSATVPEKPLAYVVDDDAAVRSAVKGILAGNGYRVWDAGSPLEAIQRFTEATPGNRPAVIVTDVIMPEMTGMRMVDYIVELDPTVRVVYMSGFVHGNISWTGMPGGTVRAINKPFEMAELIASVNEVLGIDAADDPAASTGDRASPASGV